jgi:hypothetical protein
MTVRKVEKRVEVSSPCSKIKLLLLLAVVLTCLFPGPTIAQQSPGASGAQDTGVDRVASMGQPDQKDPSLGIAARLTEIEKTLERIRITGEASESRSLENKIMTRELTRWVKAVVFALVVIAVSFPLTIWLITRRRLLGVPGLSDEVAATILVVEERQAKLVSILKDIQSEVEYLYSSTGPDLKNLLEQAEKYLEQNRRDLERTGTKR